MFEKFPSIPVKYNDILMIIFSAAILFILFQAETDEYNLKILNITLAAINLIYQTYRFFKNNHRDLDNISSDN
jgi:hypothetical protein